MFCVHCGAQLPENTKYCPMCGSAVESTAHQEATDWSPYVRPQKEPEPVQPQEFVWPEFMQTPVEAEFKERPEEPAKPRNKKKFWLYVCAAAVLIIAVAAVLLLTVKKTVYLPVSNVQMQEGIETGWVFDYDAQGRLTKMERGYEIAGTASGWQYEVKMIVYYFYLPNGNLKRAELYFAENGGIETQMVVEYQYKGKVLQDFTIRTDEEEAPLEVECDRKGRITAVTVLDEEGQEEGGWEFDYYGHGGVSESVFWTEDGRKQERDYDREGRLTQMSLFQSGELQHKLVQTYDDHGNLVRQTNFTDSGVAAEQTIELDYTYEKDRIVDMQIRSNERRGENTQSLTVDFDCRWDGNECEMTVEDVDGDGGLLGITGEELEDFCILLEKDKKGNTLYYEVTAGDEELLSVEYEYEAYKLPWYYKRVEGTAEPEYLFYLMDAIYG